MGKRIVTSALCIVAALALQAAYAGTEDNLKKLSEQIDADTSTLAAKDDLVVRVGSPCPNGVQGNWVEVVNNNTSERIYATIQIDSSPANYPVLDRTMVTRPEATPISVGLLFLPSEKRRVGCQSQRITGTVATVRYRYSVPGAYYPAPNLQFPNKDVAQDSVRFISLPMRIERPEACQSSNPPTGLWLVRNSHPSRRIVVEIVGIFGGPPAAVNTFILDPEDYKVAGCNSNKLQLRRADFVGP